METTRIEARVGVRATPERLWEIITDLPHWNRWNPYETDVSGAIAFGGALAMTERLPGLPERRVQARIGDWQPYARLVWNEKRGWLFNATRYITLEELEPGSCIVAVGLITSGLRGELFHDRSRKTVRRAFEEIGEGLRTLAEA